MLGMTAGHLEIGENPILGMLREMKEEIGVDALEEELEFLSIKKCDNIKNTCFLYMYFYQTNKTEEEYLLQTEEVSNVKYVTLEELKKISEDTNLATFSGWEAMPMILKKLEERKRRIVL